jgi:hypothetical protein
MAPAVASGRQRSRILPSVMRRFGFERALVSETDILDGLAYESLDIG